MQAVSNLISAHYKISFKKIQLPVFVILFVFPILAILQVCMERPMFMLERFFSGGGWIQVILISIYAGILAYFMQDSRKSAYWRRLSWFIFSVVFFSQLLLGIFVSEKFLMSGNLHLPLPFMIISGPLYRGEISVMTILFLGTVLISGPAWCSHLCYFGGLDNFISGNGRSSKKLKNKFRIKHSVLFIVILVSLVFRWIGVNSLVALSTAIVAGIAGFFIIGKYSRNTGKMVHCSLYCPVGTVVSYYSRINPFRMYIEDDCSACMKCSLYCKYDALQKQDILNHKPGNTCTLCGDCITTCHSGSLKYRFLKMKPEISRYMYLFISISLHAICLAIARI